MKSEKVTFGNGICTSELFIVLFLRGKHSFIHMVQFSRKYVASLINKCIPK